VLLQVGAARGTSPTRDKDQPEMSERTHGRCGRVAARSRCPAPGARRGPPSADLGAAAVRGFGIPGVDLRRARDGGACLAGGNQVG
jgi:hypothetical protein